MERPYVLNALAIVAADRARRRAGVLDVLEPASGGGTAHSTKRGIEMET